ncbi:hypothetical protein NDU88_009807 [Pleurodeles waltl]|uniref:Uncharacterized protein n=1 Tax=Pleurodeles waltl TaxID=8319 RepID=A0AAV7QUK6_PLEWA|nr:hypothetical protein NDU88_009807 [Pleurodeles waltl]
MTNLAHQGPLDSRLPRPSHTPPQSLPHLETPPQHPPRLTHTSVPRTHQSAVCPPLQETQGTPHSQDIQGPGVSGSGHTVQGTEAQDNRETGRSAVHQGEDRPRERNLQEALAEILEAYQESQDTMGQILDNVQENRRRDSQWPSKEGYVACYRQGRADPEGLPEAEHPLSETVGGPEMLGMEDGGGPVGDGLPTRKGCPSNPDPQMACILVVAYPELDGA